MTPCPKIGRGAIFSFASHDAKDVKPEATGLLE
jgi:hypothetical protein